MGKEEFVPKYKEMLHTTTIASVEDTASVLGIDLTDEAFWISALETAKSRIEEIIEIIAWKQAFISAKIHKWWYNLLRSNFFKERFNEYRNVNEK